ncbi:paired domain-containing protein [Trichonephila clavipes]|nr:paired domain-containing protein [Trichonephila clavipes]
MGLSQADAARRLNVSHNVVQRLWDQYQSEDSVSRRPVPGRPRATTPAEDRFLALSARRRKNHYCAAARCRPLSSIRKKNLRYYGAKSSSQCGLYAKKTSCVRSPQRTTVKEPLMLGREHVSWTQQQWASVLFTDESIYNGE